MKKNHTGKVLFIACGTLREELNHIVMQKYPSAEVQFTNPTLDINPTILTTTVKSLLDIHADAEKIILVFGRCSPHMDSLVDNVRVFRLRGGSCYEILLGDAFSRIMREEPGSYFLTPFLCINFTRAVIEPLRLTSHVLKERFFKNYTQVILIDTGLHTGLEECGREVSVFLNLPLKVIKIDLEELGRRVDEAVCKSA
jgi:hypothetical protein